MPAARAENLCGLPLAVGMAAPPPPHPTPLGRALHLEEQALQHDNNNNNNNTNTNTNIVLRSEKLSGRSLSISHVKFVSINEGCSLEHS